MGSLTLDEHIALAHDILHAQRLLASVTTKLGKLGKRKSNKSYKLYLALQDLKASLDTDYHALISDDEFREHGHIYYGGKRGIPEQR